MKYTFCVPCLMGVEALVADELKFNNFENVRSENGRVFFDGDMGECARANINLRCGERVLLHIASFSTLTFDDLFEGAKALNWEQFISKDNSFPVKGYSINSALHSIPDCQRILKKAMVESLKLSLHTALLPERGAKVQVQFAIMNDMCDIFIDTTGPSLYKRGYRLATNEAPIRETLAASMVKVSRYRGREDFYDPFCGSGTIVIEAAMAAMGIAPGKMRNFDAENWSFYNTTVWEEERQNAISKENIRELPIYASDVSPDAIALCTANAKRAGIEGLIHIQRADVMSMDFTGKTGTLITNPPYGQRLLDIEEARDIYKGFGKIMKKAPELKKYIISSDEQFEALFGMKADKKRKLYNGMIKCNLFMYYK